MIQEITGSMTVRLQSRLSAWLVASGGRQARPVKHERLPTIPEISAFVGIGVDRNCGDKYTTGTLPLGMHVPSGSRVCARPWRIARVQPADMAG